MKNNPGTSSPGSLHNPNPALDEEEQRLLDQQPEECLRRAVGRGALSLDRVTAELSPRAAAVVRAVAGGERTLEPPPDLGIGGLPFLPPPTGPGAGMSAQMNGWTPPGGGPEQPHLAPYPELARMVAQGDLSPDEAMEAVHAIESMLGRYLTGTLYAAP